MRTKLCGRVRIGESSLQEFEEIQLVIMVSNEMLDFFFSSDHVIGTKQPLLKAVTNLHRGPRAHTRWVFFSQQDLFHT